MTEDDLEAIGQVVASLQREWRKELAILERRVAELEARPSMKYLGVWDPHVQYNVGNLVTKAGSIWHANKSTRSEPGTSTDWQLAVKRGKNGREVSDAA